MTLSLFLNVKSKFEENPTIPPKKFNLQQSRLKAITTKQQVTLRQRAASNLLANCKFLFDQGSQVTLISNKFVNHFQLKSNGSKEMQICGVTGEGVSKKYKTYPISIQTNEGVINITAIAYDNLPTIQMPGYNKVINNLKNECNNLAKYPLNPVVVQPGYAFVNRRCILDQYLILLYVMVAPGEKRVAQVFPNLSYRPSTLGAIQILCNAFLGNL